MKRIYVIKKGKVVETIGTTSSKLDDKQLMSRYKEMYSDDKEVTLTYSKPKEKKGEDKPAAKDAKGGSKPKGKAKAKPRGKAKAQPKAK